MDGPAYVNAMLSNRLTNTLKRKSIRLQEYDYTRAGTYFVTLCAHQRECVFGNIVVDQIHLSPIGAIVQDEWLWSPLIRTYMHLDAFVITPNHVHGIIVLDPEQGTARRAPTSERCGAPVERSLPTIVRAFKSASTSEINRMRNTPGAPVWQRSFYEHVICDDRDLERIRTYIINNPSQWRTDADNPTNTSPLQPPGMSSA